MKAIVYHEYGSPDVLRIEDVEMPTPGDDEVLIKVYAASANPLDWHLMRGEPFLARLEAGLRKPKNPFLGADVAGRVEAVGVNATRFRPGDAVFGNKFQAGLGAFAEYVCAHEDALALIPATMSFEEAAAVPVVALTALQGLRDKGHIQAGQRVLVNGAAGGVGTCAVQIAKSYGAEVTGVCSTRNVDLVLSIGAHRVIDYTQVDFTNNGQQYDLIFDCVANHSVAHLRRALSPEGRCVIAGFSTMSHLLSIIVFGSLVSVTGRNKIGQMGTVQTNQPDLATIRELLESGKFVPVIDRRYPLSETPEAIRYLEAGHAHGKVIITVANNVDH